MHPDGDAKLFLQGCIGQQMVRMPVGVEDKQGGGLFLLEPMEDRIGLICRIDDGCFAALFTNGDVCVD
jgi:hypothetical protein